MLKNARVTVVGLAAFSGTGKTTLLTRLIPLLRARGLRVGVVKHAHHSFEIDKRGKDSHELRQAGANPVLIGSRHRWALMMETPGQDEPVLDDLLARLDQDVLDLVLVEGFKHEEFPKIELHRPSVGKPLLYPEDPSVMAIATDGALANPAPGPILDLNRPEQIAAFIVDHVSPTPDVADMA